MPLHCFLGRFISVGIPPHMPPIFINHVGVLRAVGLDPLDVIQEIEMIDILHVLCCVELPDEEVREQL